MMDNIKEALDSGHKASTVLKDVLELISELPCPQAYGFEGLATFSDCGKCIVCISKKLK
jgi:hypothetical protein